MADIMDITELEFSDDNFRGFETKSSNFGGGLELLMNDRIKEGRKPTSDIDLEDLNNLENELNNLADETSSSSFKPKSDMFGGPSVSFSEPSIQFGNDSGLGHSTSQTEKVNKTWDG